MKYIKNYASRAEYNADARPTDGSVVSNIEGVGVKYEGKNIFVPKESADVGDILVLDNGELRYVKLDTYDAALTTVEPIGVVYYRTNSEIRIVYKDALGTHLWAEAFRAKVSGFGNSGTHVITVNSNEYEFSYESGNVATAIADALPSGQGWSVEDKEGYLVIRRNWYTPYISSFDISGLDVQILNEDWQVKLTGFLNANTNVTRSNGSAHNFGGGCFEKFLDYYRVSGSENTNVNIGDNAVVRESVFNEVDNPILFNHYDTYEDYIRGNMVKLPYTKNAVTDKDGQANTNALQLTYIDDDGVKKPCFPAAHAAKSVTAGNVNFWLPSCNEMAKLVREMKIDYSDPVNRSLTLIGARFNLGATHWSSSERTATNSWVYNFTGHISSYLKNYSHQVRPVSAFYF